MKYILPLLLLAVSLPFLAFSENQELLAYNLDVIHANGIKAWIDSGKKVVILDARTKEYDDGKRLPGAKQLPYNAQEAEIQKMIPSQDTTIIVYCSNSQCPASKLLSERLLDMGYKNIYKYPEGLADWVKRGYPTETQQ